MKPSRKLNRGSFMSRVSGGGAPEPGRQGKTAPEGDHDLVQPAGGGGEPGADPDGARH